jgi:tyrosine-specific transport protein
LLPPLSLGTFNPTIFFHALEYTGVFSVSILGGIMPVLMRWKQSQKPEFTNSNYQTLVPGGKITLIVIFGGALLLIIRKVFSIFQL